MDEDSVGIKIGAWDDNKSIFPLWSSDFSSSRRRKHAAFGFKLRSKTQLFEKIQKNQIFYLELDVQVLLLN
jgi:hypothetical protein